MLRFLFSTLFLCSLPCAFGVEKIEQRLPAQFSQKKVLSDLVSLEGNYSDKDGYLIITTNDLTQQLQSLQKFVSHKKNFGDFNVFVATENDFIPHAPHQNLPYYGHQRAHALLHFLKENYQKLNLKYVLFIGFAHPEFGDIPMIKLNPNQELLAQYKEGAPFVNPEGQPSDYPYVDLDSQYDVDGDGYFSTKGDFIPANAATEREPEVYVGRIPYYGEESLYGKAQDVDIILERCIRYDKEEDIAWRYNSLMLEINPKFVERKKFYDEHGFNYELVERFKFTPIGLRSALSPQGQTLSNWQQVQLYPVAFKHTHSHGGPMGMEGLYSKEIADGSASDAYPTVFTLGACSIGCIEHSQNLMYTLLRFQSVAASGGTRSVSNYGGDTAYVDANKLHKDDILLSGRSVGQAHWGWYGALFKKTAPTPTASLINLYGDPSLVTFRNGPHPPFPFFVNKGEGFFSSYASPEDLKQEYVLTLSNKQEQDCTVSVRCDQPWLCAAPMRIKLRAGEEEKITLHVNTQDFKPSTDKAYDIAYVYLSDDKGFQTRRPFVLKALRQDFLSLYNFEHLDNDTIPSQTGEGNVWTSKPLQRFVQQYKELSKQKLTEQQKLKACGGKTQPLVEGRDGKAFSLKYFPISTPIIPLEGEDFTLAFWVKWGKQSHLTLSTPEGFSLTARQGALAGFIKNYIFDEEGIQNYPFQADIPEMDDEQWHHIALSLDQNEGVLSLYHNGKIVHQSPLHPHQHYNLQELSFQQSDAEIDDFIFTTQASNKAQIAKLMDAACVKVQYPREGQEWLSPDRIVFKIYQGKGIKKAKLVIFPQDQPEVKHSISLEGAEAIAQQLLPQTTYQYYITYGQEKKTPTRTFKTAESLILHDFESEELPFTAEGIRKTHKAPLEGKSSLCLEKAARDYIYEIPHAYEPHKAYRLSMLTRISRSSRLAVKIYAKDQDKDILLGTFTTANAAENIDFAFKTGEQKYEDTTLYLHFLTETDLAPDHAKYPHVAMQLDLLSLVKFDAAGLNLPPVLVEGAEKLCPPFKQGDIGTHILLSELVKDPEGGALEFKMLQGPRWLNIQGEALFSNFGPGEDLGLKTVTLSASDIEGNITTFNLQIEAIK